MNNTYDPFQIANQFNVRTNEYLSGELYGKLYCKWLRNRDFKVQSIGCLFGD